MVHTNCRHFISTLQSTNPIQSTFGNSKIWLFVEITHVDEYYAFIVLTPSVVIYFLFCCSGDVTGGQKGVLKGSSTIR